MASPVVLEKIGVTSEIELPKILLEIGQTSSLHRARMEGVMKVLEERRQTYAGEENLPWVAKEAFLQRAINLTLDGQPLVFTFPGFPFKSANNLTKVLGPDVDQAERRSAANLVDMFEELNTFYPCKLVIASDGLPFSQMWMVGDDATQKYYDQMEQLFGKASFVVMCSMNDLILEGATVDDKRKIIEERFADSVEDVNRKIENDPEAMRYYTGLKHFIVGDLGPVWKAFAESKGEKVSNNEVARKAAQTARDFVRLNDAYNAVVKSEMPPVMRLSCHPQAPDNVDKVGIDLIYKDPSKGRSWGTPWQNCLAQLKDGSWVLTRKKEAEAAGYVVRHSEDGRPSHYEEV